MRTRQHRIAFHLNDREMDNFDRAVKKSGLNYSAYIRHLINSRIPQERPPREYFELLRELRAIGRNINQIAFVANASGSIEDAKYDENYKDLLKLILTIIDECEMPKEVN